jgi:hypothetical protein
MARPERRRSRRGRYSRLPAVRLECVYSNVDIYGNDVFDTSDDGIELDYGSANVRVWANRIHNAVHNGISFEPQAGAPWYIVRNQIVGNVESAFKFRTTDRFVLLHNTVVNWGNAWPGSSLMCCNEWARQSSPSPTAGRSSLISGRLRARRASS